jgi:D-alanyl-D-alanine carboxypeptidase/D-alanyl-D-alanine-endopeptidase (penicillin-binding protein 4)
MKRYQVHAFWFVTLLLTSCSISRKINRSAEKNVLTNEAFVSAHTGISIYEPSTGKYWYNYQADKYFTPASNTKLATCYAAMKYLGDSLVGIKYQQEDDSTVMIEGTGDPSFLHSDYAVNPVYDFLTKFANIRVADRRYGEFMGSGWGWDDYMEDYMAQRSSFPIYGNIVKIRLANNGVLDFMPNSFQKYAVITEPLSHGFRATKSWDSNAFVFSSGNAKSREIPFIPDEKTLVELLRDTLHRDVSSVDHYNGTMNRVIHSQPVDSLLKPMMHRSDNFFAEQCLLMVSDRLLGVMSDRKIIDTLLKTDYLGMPQKPDWVDGCGLSRYDLFSPKDFVFILGKMKDDFGMDRIKNILPTGGTGTISSYYRSDSGYIFVKTGTLHGVVALSGFLYTKKNKLLLFSVLVNNHRSSATSIRRGVEKFIQSVRDKF